MNKLFYPIAASLYLLLSCQSEIQNAKTEKVKISGNCEMCKKNIQTAGTVQEISKVEWDEKSKLATITYNSEKTSADEVLKNISLAGYDSDAHTSPTEAYNKLHECCKYPRASKDNNHVYQKQN